MKNFISTFKELKIVNFLFLTLAGIINAFGVVVFLAPVKLYDSGISGTSMLISQETPAWCSLSLILILLNIPLFLLGLKREGLKFTVYAIYTVFIYSLVAWIITDILPIDVSFISPLAGNDLFLCAIFGGVISGCGSGLAMRYGRNRYSRRNVCKKTSLKHRHIHYDLQCNSLYHLRHSNRQLDIAALFHSNLCRGC